MNDNERTHLSPERIQAFLGGTLPETEADPIRAHLTGCDSCSSEVQAWKAVFVELGELVSHAPSPDFSDRVMLQLSATRGRAPGWLKRVRGWIGGRRAALVGHLGGTELQDFLDGQLPRRRMAVLEAHLGACRLCREEMRGWRGVLVELDSLPALEPSAAFSERVMAHVRVSAALAYGRPGVAERFRAWTESLNPRTRRRVAGWAGAAVTPAASFALLAYYVVSHPLTSTSNVFSFVSLQANDWISAAFGQTIGPVLEHPVASSLIPWVGGLFQTPWSAAIAILSIVALTVGSGWTLHRNLNADAKRSRYAYF